MHETLLTVVTVTEAAEYWNKHRLTVLRAGDAVVKPLCLRRTNRTVLVTVDSLVNRWGQPIKPLSTLLR